MYRNVIKKILLFFSLLLCLMTNSFALDVVEKFQVKLHDSDSEDVTDMLIVEGTLKESNDPALILFLLKPRISHIKAFVFTKRESFYLDKVESFSFSISGTMVRLGLRSVDYLAGGLVNLVNSKRFGNIEQMDKLTLYDYLSANLRATTFRKPPAIVDKFIKQL